MRTIKTIIIRNLTNFCRNKIQIAFSIIMPLFLMFTFSFVMKSNTIGYSSPLNYLIAGIIIMTVFQSALTNSTSIIEDIANGFMKEIIVSPSERWQISLGQISSAVVISVLQGLIVVIMGLFMGLKISVLQFIGMFIVMIAVGFTFSAIGLFLASLSKNSTTFQMITNVLLMPLTFLSGAYIPTNVMPKIVQPLVYINPLTYTTAIFRYITLKMWNMTNKSLIKAGVAFNLNGFIIKPYEGFLIILAMCAIFFVLSVRQFNTTDFSKVKVFNHHEN
ncbi:MULTISPECIES: ABC transporter permease [Clostridium]|uniref:ABC transporter permease n=1 Tax=Clostridium TaxID=1485 RepID=UPI000826F55D|nr:MULTISPECIES: ABC transporter permease [Clostridium]PJI07536.1 transporter [Clostridium sp. CT7]